MIINECFWDSLQCIIDSSKIVVDGLKNSVHPDFDCVCPLDYGHLKTKWVYNGGKPSCFVGSLNSGRLMTGVCKVTGAVCTVDVKKNDCKFNVLIDCWPCEMGLIYSYLNVSDFFRAFLVVRK